MKYLSIHVLGFLLLLYSTFSLSLDPIYTGGREKAAIKGYDTVAYFTEGKAIKGKASISHTYKGATWWFSTEENKQTFIHTPEQYAPQYGGYCAYAVSRKTSASIKPEVFNIHEGKLYLNYSNGVQRRWLKDIETSIEKADTYWPEVLKK